MKKLRKGLTPIMIVAALIAIAATNAQRGAAEEATVVRESKPPHSIDAPALSAPANQPTLPPPARPVQEAEEKKPATTGVRRPFMRPAVPKSAEGTPAELTVGTEPIPVPESASPPIEVRPTPPIKYDTDSDARRMYRHTGEINLIMVTQNPADGCYYEIPLCIPGCCVGEPTIDSGHGIFGRGVVEYCWPSCGFRAIVKFRHVLGDVRVDYEGD
jgi:hypothetical protein